MSRKSLVERTAVDHALKAHRCQASAKHLLSKGSKRLKVWSGRSPDHYCVACALAIVRADILKLQAIEKQLASEDQLITQTGS